jgi:hypothetical protein
MTTRFVTAFTLVLAMAACSQPPASQDAGGNPSAAPATASAAAEKAPAAERAPAADKAPAPASSSAPAPASAPPSRAAESAAPEKPAAREITIPAGTSMSVKLLNSLASDTSKVEDTVRGSLARAIVIDGVTAVPAGSPVLGSVLEAAESGRVKGRASIAFGFDRLTVDGESHRIRTARIAREAEADRKGDVKKGAIGAGAGAIVGGILGGGKGAALGAGIGGAGAVVATKGKEVALPAGTTISTTLEEPLTVTVVSK